MSPSTRGVLHLLFAGSGAAALIYQVLWVREFAVLFGSTAETAAAILAAFFLGLALGADFFGRRADESPRPLRLYARLELGIALAALPVPAALVFYRSIYDDLYPALIGVPGLFTLFKMVLTGLVLLPATAMMGGTLPALGRALIGDASALGRKGGRLYAVNVAGAVIGALLAASGLPLWLGVTGAYGLAVALNLIIAGWSAQLAARQPEMPPVRPEGRTPAGREAERTPHARHLLAIAFLSGFATIGLELLWTRMLALVFQNSVYSFGAVVAVFLGGLSLGAVAVAWLLGRYDPWRVLRASMLATGVLILLTPAVLMVLTGGLRSFTGHGEWLTHTVWTIGVAAAVILPPVITAGMVLPCVWELWRERRGSGSRLGRPTAVNTLGAILGPLVAGFAALPALGLGAAIAAMAALYLVMAEVVVPSARSRRRRGLERAAVYPAIVLVLLGFPPWRLPTARVAEGERLLWADEGARGAVAVVERNGARRIKLDNQYAIGGSHVAVEERRHGHLPLLLHPAPRSVAYIGMGTGITAGAALAHRDVERVVVMELVPEVIEAARDYFRPWNAGLVEDPRAEVVVEDGRNHMAGTDERFDVVVGDLFVPWREGVGSLYTREHFQTVRGRLSARGVFAQWLPLWQMSRREFDIIAATFLSVFDHASLWRGVFSPVGASVALVGYAGEGPVDVERLTRHLEVLRRRDPFRDSFLGDLTGFMILYAGDLSPLRERLDATPRNSDRHPRIEWLAPRTLRAVQEGEASWMTGEELADLFETINAEPRLPADSDFVGAPMPPRVYRRAGALFYRAEVAAASGDRRAAAGLRRQAYALLEAASHATSGTER